jgi:pyridoxine 5-phosphate synthase
VPHLDEVSIGHAIVSRAIFVGLDRVVREYVTLLEGETVA